MPETNSVVLHGRVVRLEPLGPRHAAGLTAASGLDPSLYRWSAVPVGSEAVERYIDAAIALQRSGTALCFATVRVEDNVVLGSTRFFDVERFAWPADHPRHGHTGPDVCEIGYTWLSAASIRTAANTEAKLLMLTYAFEVWRLLRVCFHTDARNDRSAAALERLGARPEGILRAHRMAPDFIARDSKRFSIVAAEWPAMKEHLLARLERGSSAAGP